MYATPALWIRPSAPRDWWAWSCRRTESPLKSSATRPVRDVMAWQLRLARHGAPWLPNLNSSTSTPENPTRSHCGKTCRRRRCIPMPTKWQWNKCWQPSAARAPGRWPACYFNPVGAHPSGRIEKTRGSNNCSPSSLRWPQDVENACAFSARTTPHQMALASVITCVMDLAEAHGTALDHLFERQASDPLTLNGGTGRGLSVLDVVHGFERATDWPSPTRSWSADPAMCPPRGLPPDRTNRAGLARRRSLRRCAVMAGPGKPIHPDTEIHMSKGACSSWPAEGTAMRSC